MYELYAQKRCVFQCKYGNKKDLVQLGLNVKTKKLKLITRLLLTYDQNVYREIADVRNYRAEHTYPYIYKYKLYIQIEGIHKIYINARIYVIYINNIPVDVQTDTAQ